MKERLNQVNMFNLTTQGHASRNGWPETVRALYAGTAAREAAGGGERIRIVDNWGHVFGADWLFSFNNWTSIISL